MSRYSELSIFQGTGEGEGGGGLCKGGNWPDFASWRQLGSGHVGLGQVQSCVMAFAGGLIEVSSV